MDNDSTVLLQLPTVLDTIVGKVVSEVFIKSDDYIGQSGIERQRSLIIRFVDNTQVVAQIVHDPIRESFSQVSYHGSFSVHEINTALLLNCQQKPEVAALEDVLYRYGEEGGQIVLNQSPSFLHIE